jgi:hypothetical protein
MDFWMPVTDADLTIFSSIPNSFWSLAKAIIKAIMSPEGESSN